MADMELLPPASEGHQGAPTNNTESAELVRVAEEALDAAEQSAEDAVDALEDAAYSSRDGETQVQVQDFGDTVESLRAQLEDTNSQIRDLRRYIEGLVADAGAVGDELGGMVEAPIAEAEDGAEAIVDEVPAAAEPIMERRRVFTRKHRRH